jgi:hypothetical protein
MAENGRLSVKQEKAIATLLLTRDTAHAAERAGVGERTLRRWLAEDEVFQSSLKAAEAAAVRNAACRLAFAADSAITVILVLMLGADTPASVRLKAALGILDQLAKLRQLTTLEERIAKLEEHISLTGTQRP